VLTRITRIPETAVGRIIAFTDSLAFSISLADLFSFIYLFGLVL